MLDSLVYEMLDAGCQCGLGLFFFGAGFFAHSKGRSKTGYFLYLVGIVGILFAFRTMFL